MQWVKFIVLLIIVTLLQANPVNLISVKDITPDLLLILLVFWAVHFDITDAIIGSFAIGFAFDLIGPSVGPGVIGFGLLGTLLARLNKFIAIRKKTYQVAAVFIVGVLTGILIYLLSLFKSKYITLHFFAFVFGRSLYSGLVGPLLFLFFFWLFRSGTHRFARGSF